MGLRKFFKTYHTPFVLLLLAFVRFLDLWSTHLAITDIHQQEQHFIVKGLGFGYFELVIFELGYFILISLLFLWSTKNKTLIKKSLSFWSFLFKQNLKSILAFIGSFLPYLYIIGGLFISLNNIWVYYYSIDNNFAIKYYNLLNSYNFFDFMIFQMPYLLFFLSSYYWYWRNHKT